MTKFCPQCGSSLNDGQRFCNKCGVSLQPTTPYAEAQSAPPAYAPPPPSAQVPYGNVGASYQYPNASGQGQVPQQMPPAGPGGFNLGLTTPQLSALCYLLPFVGGLLGLVVEPYNRDRLIRFHAWQSILFALAWFVLRAIALPVLGFTFLPSFLVWLLGLGVGLGFFCAWIYLIVQTWQGQMLKLPLLGDVAEQQAHNSTKL